MSGFDNTKSELLIASVTALIAEAVAVTLFLACGFVWLAIYSTGGQ